MTGIQQAKEEHLIVLEFSESDFEAVCPFGGAMEEEDGAERFLCLFVNSILRIFDDRKSNTLICHGVGEFHSIVLDICHFTVNSSVMKDGNLKFWTNGSQITRILQESLRMRHDLINSDVGMSISNSHFLLRIFQFVSSIYDGYVRTRIGIGIGIGIGLGRRWPRDFEKKEEMEERSLLCLFSGHANRDFVYNVARFREVLRLGGGSRFGSRSGDLGRDLTRLIEIDESHERIAKGDFEGYSSLSAVVFRGQIRLKSISGFSGCSSLPRIDIPSSVEVIGNDGFSRCRSLTEIVFCSDSHLTSISGFCGCLSLPRIEIPSSVEVITTLVSLDAAR
jgi:hypothetical protein